MFSVGSSRSSIDRDPMELLHQQRSSKKHTYYIERGDLEVRQFTIVRMAILKYLNRFISLLWDAGDSRKLGYNLNNFRTSLNVIIETTGWQVYETKKVKNLDII